MGSRGAKSSSSIKKAKSNKNKIEKSSEAKEEKTKETNYYISKKHIEEFKELDSDNYYTTTISPENFLKITTKDSDRETIEKETEEKGPLDLEKMNKGYMMLTIDRETNKVLSHEGRHRMQLLKNNGYKEVEIIIKANYDNNWTHDYGVQPLKHQTGEQFETSVSNLKFISKRRKRNENKSSTIW